MTVSIRVIMLSISINVLVLVGCKPAAGATINGEFSGNSPSIPPMSAVYWLQMNITSTDAVLDILGAPSLHFQQTAFTVEYGGILEEYQRGFSNSYKLELVNSFQSTSFRVFTVDSFDNGSLRFILDIPRLDNVIMGFTGEAYGSYNGQDFLPETNVPEPNSFGMVLFGMALVGMVSSRMIPPRR